MGMVWNQFNKFVFANPVSTEINPQFAKIDNIEIPSIKRLSKFVRNDVTTISHPGLVDFDRFQFVFQGMD